MVENEKENGTEMDSELENFENGSAPRRGANHGDDAATVAALVAISQSGGSDPPSNRKKIRRSSHPDCTMCPKLREDVQKLKEKVAKLKSHLNCQRQQATRREQGQRSQTQKSRNRTAPDTTDAQNMSLFLLVV
jgi:TolA-binding protein